MKERDIYFHKECERADENIKSFQNTYKDVLEKKQNEVTAKEYSTGSKRLHRGFYCPSLILDIIVGNCKRGKLLKHLTLQSKPNYQYGFNKDHQLIISKNISPEFFNEIEIIEYVGNTTRSCIFQEKSTFEPIGMSVCSYDDSGNILTYTYFAVGTINHRVVEFFKEEYTYSDDSFHVKREEYYEKHYFSDEFDFFLDDNKLLKTYKSNGVEYPVSVKRKIRK